MRMQEPEQRQQSGQEWQEPANQEFNAYQPEYPGYGAEQEREYSAGLAAEDYQEQKIYPEKEQNQRGKVIGIIAIVLSSIGFFVALAGIILSSIVLNYANGHEDRLAEGTIGLVGSILLMLVCIAIFVVAVIVLALRARRMRMQADAHRYQL